LQVLKLQQSVMLRRYHTMVADPLRKEEFNQFTIYGFSI
jgi:hypothetical protein